MVPQNKITETKVAEKKIDEFVSRLRAAAGPNLQSVILYGSAVSSEFDPEFSDINLLCILRGTSFPMLEAVAPAVEWWNKQKQPAPLFMAREELERSADVFSMEFIDIKAQHRVLFGDDVITELKIPMHLHRTQVEYELREKLILLRQGLLLAAHDQRKARHLLLHSVSAFSTLFRHALSATGGPMPASRRESVTAIAARVGFDPSAFHQLLDVREHKTDVKKLDIEDIATRYLSSIEQVTAAVDRMLDSSDPRDS